MCARRASGKASPRPARTSRIFRAPGRTQAPLSDPGLRFCHRPSYGRPRSRIPPALQHHCKGRHDGFLSRADSASSGDDMMRIGERPACCCIVATAALAIIGGAPSTAGAEVPHNPKLPAGDAATMLREFSRQTRWEVYFDPGVVAGKRTQALDGSLRPRAALEHMLKHTGLSYNIANGDTVGVYEKQVPNTAAATADPAPGSVVIVGKRDRLGALNYSIELSDAAIRQTGYSSIQSVLRDLPQSTGNLCEDGVGDATPESKTNSARGCAENLRGLGAGATKVLFDGQPVAPGGSRGEFVDIAAMPI